jgi:hypothetical protein
MRSLVALLVLLVSCSTVPTERYAGTGRMANLGRTVDRIEVYHVFRYWTATPWYRMEDSPEDSPVFVVVDVYGHGCKVNGMESSTAFRDRLYSCPNRWRAPRES